MSDGKDSPSNWTISEVLKWTADDFAAKGIDTPRLDAEMLLAAALGCPRVKLYMDYDQVPPEDALSKFREYVKRRRDRESVAHILGSKGFHDIEVAVGPGRFVPRPETEILVDEAVLHLRKAGIKAPRLLDLCTGTGAIALAVLKAVPGLSAWAVDIDPEAKKLVIHNAEKNGLSDRVEFREGDLFGPVKDLAPFHVITCNPPYVPSGELPSLMPEVREHESHLALDGGEEGTDIIKKVLEGAPSHLESGGRLLFEVGEGQAPLLPGLAPAGMVHEYTREDLAGIERIVIFTKE